MASNPRPAPWSSHSLVAAARAAFFGTMALVAAGLFSADSGNVLVGALFLGFGFVACCFGASTVRSRHLDRLALDLSPTGPTRSRLSGQGRRS